MKYVVTLNGKNYEVEVEETDAVITAVTDAAPAIPRLPHFPIPSFFFQFPFLTIVKICDILYIQSEEKTDIHPFLPLCAHA